MKIHNTSSPSTVLLGSIGADIIADTNVHTGPYYSFKAITNCTFESVVLEDTISGSLDGVTLLAGDTILLYRMTSILLASGTGIAYKAE